jgi:hypothetical protein
MNPHYTEQRKAHQTKIVNRIVEQVRNGLIQRVKRQKHADFETSLRAGRQLSICEISSLGKTDKAAYLKHKLKDSDLILQTLRSCQHELRCEKHITSEGHQQLQDIVGNYEQNVDGMNRAIAKHFYSTYIE